MTREHFKSANAIAAGLAADVKFGRAVERLYRKGPRVIAELLAELGAERSITTIIENKLDRFGEIDDEALRATGGDRFSPTPLHEVMPTDKGGAS